MDRVQFSEPDVHLAHNIPDLILEMPDGSEQRCDFLSYYESTHGVVRWGHAISEVLEEYPGILTQYYQGGVVDCTRPTAGGWWSVAWRGTSLAAALRARRTLGSNPTC